MSVASLIRGVRPKNTAKWLEAELDDCSPRQAWRIVQTGKVPGRFRAALMRVLDAAIASNKIELDRLQDELRSIAYKEMVARSDDRRASADRTNVAENTGLADRPKNAPLGRGGAR